MVDGVDVVRAFAHYEFGISELAVCDSGGDCGVVLWVGVEEDRVDFCFGAGACGGGCDVAFFVSDDVRRKTNLKNEKEESPSSSGAEKLKLRFFARPRRMGSE